VTRHRAHRGARRLPPAIHTDAAHRAITTELVRLTLLTRGGGPVPAGLQCAAAIVLVAIAAGMVSTLLTAALLWRR